MGDYRTTSGESLPLTTRAKRKRLSITVLIVASVATAVVLTGMLVEVDRYVPASGYVTTEKYAEVRPGGVGTIASDEVPSSGTMVQQGDLLVRLDSAEELATLEEAQSRVHQTEAEFSRRQAEIGEQKRRLQEGISIAKLRLRSASSKLLRTKELLTKGLVAGNALEDDKLKEELARAELTSLLSRDPTIFAKELDVLKQELQARRDAAKRASARVRAKEVHAPISGQLLRYEFEIGELVRPETVLYEIFGGTKQVLKLQVAERYAMKVAQGQQYSALLASYRSSGLQKTYFRGQVEHLRNVIQSEGQKTYRVAYCSFDAMDRAVPPGTSAEARIYYGRSNLWFYLLGWD